MTVSIPSAVQIIAWITTMWHGRVVLRTAMLFAIGFIAQFVIGGISGVMTAVVPFDWQATDNYFVVAHLHYVLAGGTLFAVFSALYCWFPKMTGRLLDERVGKLSFWVMFVGFNLAFFPMHIAGLLGMARRVYTYLPGLGLDEVNMLSTVGAVIFAAGTLVTLYNVVQSSFGGVPAGPDPWGGPTLEWAASSPPAPYDFARMPVVHSRDPLWDDGVEAGPAYDEARLTPRTSPLDAELEAVIELPAQSVWTLVISLALLGFFTGVLVRLWWLMIAGGVLTLISMVRWMWPAPSRVLSTEGR
jgi:heme/copper-type cytochrome/quinol oxidase subunit 1